MFLFPIFAQQSPVTNAREDVDRAMDSVREMSGGLVETGRETWEAVRHQTAEAVGVYLPNILAALGVLIVGWLLALLIAGIVRRILHRTKLDQRLFHALEAKAGDSPQLERNISRGVFWFLMLFVLIAFFHTLQLTAVSDPLSSFLNSIFEYLPRLIAATVLLFFAWVVATILRYSVKHALVALKVDRRLSRTAGVEGETDVPVTTTVAEATYWLVFLLFLPAVLNALALPGLLAPVQEMVAQILAFLPKLFAAAIVLVVGWLVARIVQSIVTNILSAVGLDRLSSRWGVSNVLGDRKLSSVLGLLVYILILIPVIVASLNALSIEAVTQPASNMLQKILGILPNLVAAALVITIAYVVGRVVSGLIVNLLSGLGFDGLPHRLGLTTNGHVGRRTPSQIAGYVLMVAIMLFAVMQGLSLIGFDMVAQMMSQFLVFAFNVLLGLVIFAFGLFFAQLVAGVIRDSRIARAEFLSHLARLSIIVLAGAMALQEMGLAANIVELAFGLTLGAIAVAAAIAFGIGGRDVAKEVIEKTYRKQFKD